MPTWRARDVTREVDLVEEVARVVLDRVPHTMPLRRSVAGHLSREQRLRRALEDVLVGAGFTEAYTWSLVAVRSGPGRAARRRADERRPGHAADDAARRSRRGRARERRRGQRARSRLFELARVYLPSGEQLPDERWRVGGIAERRLRGRASRGRGALRRLPPAARGAAGDRAPSSTRARRPRPTQAGSASSTRPCSRARGASSSSTSPTLMAPLPERILYDDVITYPALRQDIAVVVDEDVEAGALVDAALEAGGAELREATRLRRLPRRPGGRGAEVGRDPPRRSRRPTGR